MSEELNYVRELYQEVVQSFPDIKEDEIEITYNPYWDSIAGYWVLNEEKTKKKPGIFIGEYFFNLTREEQEGTMAHEIGHYRRVRNRTLKNVKRITKLEFLFSSGAFRYLTNRNKERFVKWYTMKEIDADNSVLETPYGRVFLQLLITNYNKYQKIMKKELKQVVEARIKNLEQKLGEENGML